MMFSLAMRRVAAHMLVEAIKKMNKIDKVNVTRSMDFAPSTRLWRNRPVSAAPAVPEIAPAATGSKPWRSRLPRSRTGVVPSAKRTPISRVRWATA